MASRKYLDLEAEHRLSGILDQLLLPSSNPLELLAQVKKAFFLSEIFSQYFDDQIECYFSDVTEKVQDDIESMVIDFVWAQLVELPPEELMRQPVQTMKRLVSEAFERIASSNAIPLKAKPSPVTHNALPFYLDGFMICDHSMTPLIPFRKIAKLQVSILEILIENYRKPALSNSQIRYLLAQKGHDGVLPNAVQNAKAKLEEKFITLKNKFGIVVTIETDNGWKLVCPEVSENAKKKSM